MEKNQDNEFLLRSRRVGKDVGEEPTSRHLLDDDMGGERGYDEDKEQTTASRGIHGSCVIGSVPIVKSDKHGTVLFLRRPNVKTRSLEV